MSSDGRWRCFVEDLENKIYVLKLQVLDFIVTRQNVVKSQFSKN